MCLICQILFIEIKLQIHIISFKVTTFGSHTALETILPYLITVLELRYWNSFQLVGYGCFNILECPKMTSLKEILETYLQWL